MYKKVFLFLIAIIAINCSNDENETTTNLSLDFDFKREFVLLSETTSKKVDSDFVHTFENDITIRFYSSDYQAEVTFNPNTSIGSNILQLPFGDYNWEIVDSSDEEKISQNLPIYGSSSSAVTVDESTTNLTLEVDTDYALVTVNTDNALTASLSHSTVTSTLNLSQKDGYYYGYVHEDYDNYKLSVVDTNNLPTSAILVSIESCKHYKYSLSYSDINLSSLVCVCEPFEVVDENLTPFPTLGLIAWYPFNGNSNDESGNSHNGTEFGTISSIEDRNGNSNSAYQLESNAYITSPLSLSWTDGSGLTVAGWMSYTSIEAAFSNPNILLDFQEHIDPPDAKWRFSLWQSYGTIAATQEGPSVSFFRLEASPPAVDTWNHIALTINKSSGIAKFYLNGVEVDTESNVVTLDNFTNVLEGTTALGGRIWTPRKGSIKKIDDIGIWKRPLTSNEISLLYNL